MAPSPSLFPSTCPPLSQTARPHPFPHDSVAQGISEGSLSIPQPRLLRPRAAGFEKPSAIQQKGIVPFTKGLDVIQQAQSGTGKTATFCAGVLNNLDFNQQECQGLVLAPTRELAQQIEKVMRALGDYLQVGL